jgi:two-component system sensor histidine kinase BaeS
MLIGDEIYLSRAVTNLITNAINFTPSGGEIAIDVYGRGEDVVIQVADSGIGISEEDLPHIFDRFFKSDPARSGEKGGTGLGLPITKKIVEAHGGTIEVESVLGEGSTFRLVLPLKSAPVL